ncbi:hypothetical protein OPQ81_000877 [Rhizoctonia solani]|nr:hypothetical protein OPQ81_000877 [Rhizoctonia solani]
MNDLLQLRVVELEGEKNKDAAEPAQSDKSASPEFQRSWDARTEARIKRFCSLNRAGNALCAWHDSRRERRSFPPRMAPPGHLNCGCTYEEALFEESLARHGVGSYHPGESVRMDPALRNPLLKLLQWRFGYKDGDFERDPKTGVWHRLSDGPSCVACTIPHIYLLSTRPGRCRPFCARPPYDFSAVATITSLTLDHYHLFI